MNASSDAPAVSVSFEFFPAASAATEAMLWASVRRLAPLRPRFVSVTYGADGSTRERTHAVVERLRTETDLAVVPHLAWIGTTRHQLLAIAHRYWSVGIRHLVALRGDRPSGAAEHSRCSGEFSDTTDLIRSLRSIAPFEISVAAYPEVHPDAVSPAADLEYLKRKIDAGANRAITQFCFDTDAFLRFRDACASAGIAVSIVPGILPVTRFPQVVKFAQRCGATIPTWLFDRFRGLDENTESRRIVATDLAIDQVETLRRHGVDEFHFYTLNRAELTYAICDALGLRAQSSVAATQALAAPAVPVA